MITAATVQRGLLSHLISIANDTAGWSDALSRLQPGTYFDATSKIPLIHIASLNRVTERGFTILHTDSKSLLEDAMRDIDKLDVQINMAGLPFTIYSTPKVRRGKLCRDGRPLPSIVVPRVMQLEHLPMGIMTVALMTPVSEQDVLANRIARCFQCNNFFILKSGRPSKFCSKRCRTNWLHDERKGHPFG